MTTRKHNACKGTLGPLVLLCTGGRRLGYIRHISFDGKTVLCGIKRNHWQVSDVLSVSRERATGYLCQKCDQQNDKLTHEAGGENL
jgi:hypothetical protein